MQRKLRLHEPLRLLPASPPAEIFGVGSYFVELDELEIVEISFGKSIVEFFHSLPRPVSHPYNHDRQGYFACEYDRAGGGSVGLGIGYLTSVKYEQEFK